MYRLVATEAFQTRFQALPRSIQKKFLKQERFFLENPFHPSLHTEKLQPKDRGYWSLRVDKQYRVLFRFLSSTEILLVTIGTHDWIYRMM